MKRIQRKRTKGWRMPEGAVYVGRGSRWGNPYRVGDEDPFGWCGNIVLTPVGVQFGHFDAEAAAYHYRHHVAYRDDLLAPLRDATALVCWCPLDQPCHADVLIELLAA